MSLASVALALLPALLPAPPATRPEAGDLAYALGQAHALRQRCRGSADGYWYARMTTLISIEGAGTETRRRLTARFNAGFAAARAAHPACDAAARAALEEVTAQAAPLARALARPD